MTTLRDQRVSNRQKQQTTKNVTTSKASRGTDTVSKSVNDVSQEGDGKENMNCAGTVASAVSSYSTITTIESRRKKDKAFEEQTVSTGQEEKRNNDAILMQAVIGSKIFPLFQFVNSVKELQYGEGVGSECSIPTILMNAMNIPLCERRSGWFTMEKQKWAKTRINKLRNNVMGEVLKKLTGRFLSG